MMPDNDGHSRAVRLLHLLLLGLSHDLPRCELAAGGCGRVGRRPQKAGIRCPAPHAATGSGRLTWGNGETAPWCPMPCQTLHPTGSFGSRPACRTLRSVRSADSNHKAVPMTALTTERCTTGAPAPTDWPGRGRAGMSGMADGSHYEIRSTGSWTTAGPPASGSCWSATTGARASSTARQPIRPRCPGC